MRLSTFCTFQSKFLGGAAKDRHERVGEATEVALRVLVEKIGLPSSLGTPVQLSKQERAAFCNSHWQQQYQKVSCDEQRRSHVSSLPKHPLSFVMPESDFDDNTIVFMSGSPLIEHTSWLMLGCRGKGRS